MDTKTILLLCILLVLLLYYIYAYSEFIKGRDSSVGIATRYGLDGQGIESLWRRDLAHLSRPALGPNQPPVQWVLGLFPGGKAAGAWR